MWEELALSRVKSVLDLRGRPQERLRRRNRDKGQRQTTGHEEAFGDIFLSLTPVPLESDLGPGHGGQTDLGVKLASHFVAT